MRRGRVVAGLVIVAGLVLGGVLGYLSAGIGKKTPTDVERVNKPAPGPPVTQTEPEDEEEPETPSQDAQPTELYGTVIDIIKGEPIAGARVRLSKRDMTTERFARRRVRYEEPEGEESAPTALSDETGAFSLLLDGDQEWRSASCLAAGYAREDQRIPATGPGAIRMDFALRPGARVSGRVTDAATGQGIPGVSVEAVDARRNLIERMTTTVETAQTDARGAYGIEGLSLGTYRVQVRARSKGYIFSSEQAKTIDIVEGKDWDGVDFVLEAGAVVKGTVRNRENNPVAEAHVMLLPGQMLRTAMRRMEDMTADGLGDLSDVSDHEGTFEIIGADFDFDYRARCEADEYAEAVTDLFQIRRGRSPIEIAITLSRGSLVAGTARYADGAPAVNRQLTLFPGFGAVMSGRFASMKSTTTDDRGAFRFEHVAGGSYTLLSNLTPSYGLFGRQDQGIPVHVESDKDVTGLEIVIERDARSARFASGDGVIEGIVLDPSGRPLPGARVEARQSANPMVTTGTATRNDGAFSLTKLADMPYDLTVTCDAGVGQSDNVMPGERVTIRLAPPTLVSGFVVDAQGNPAASCRVQLVRQEHKTTFSPTGAMLRNVFGDGWGGVVSDAVGYFEFKNTTAGRYIVKAKSEGAGSGATPEFAVVTGKDVTGLRIVLDPGVEFSGVVENARGEPVPGALVSLLAAPENPIEGMLAGFMPTGMQRTAGSSQADANGAFRITRAPPGEYTVAASHSDYARYQMSGLRLVSGRDVSGYRIRLGKGGNAAGRYVVDGSPREGTVIQLFGPGGAHVVTTDREGRFALDGIPEGRYIVQAYDLDAMLDLQSGDFSFTPRVIDIVDGQTLHLDLGLNQGVPVGGTVAGADPGSIVFVSLRRPGGPSFESINPFDINQIMHTMQYTVGQGIVGFDGAFRISGIEPGTYILEMYAIPIDPQRMDLQGILNISRSPRVREEIVVGDEPVQLHLTLGPEE